MRLRLPHILMLMALILAAGVVSVQQLEARRGVATVPGLIVLDAPWLDAAAAEPLLREWTDAHLFWTAADAQPFSPFDGDFARQRLVRGAQAVIVAPPAGTAPVPRDTAGVVLEAGDDAVAGARTLANYLVDHAGTLPFLARQSLDAAARASLDQVARTLRLAVAQLPSFRRTSIVVLGVREPESGRRLALRLDTHDWPRPPGPALRDLLEDAW